MERPSDSSTISASSVIVTCVAPTDRDSAVEVLMPALQQMLLVLLDDRLNGVEFLAREPPTPLQPDGVEPELRLALVTLDVDRLFSSQGGDSLEDGGDVAVGECKC